MKRPQVLKEQIQQSEQAEIRANAPETLQEDNAFMNRMRTVSFRNMEESELRRLWLIIGRELSDPEVEEFDLEYVGERMSYERVQSEIKRLIR